MQGAIMAAARPKSGGGAAAAFDPSSVSGYSRDWNFADITKLYTDTAGTIAVTADGDPIGAVLCSAGSTIKLAAPSDAARPTYETAIQNSLSVARFDGSDDYLTHATAITADASQTIFVVARKNSAIGATGKILFSMGDYVLFFADSDDGTGYNFYATAANAVSAGPGTPTSWGIAAVKFTSAASASMYFNGGAATTFDPRDNYTAYTALSLAAIAGGVLPGDYDIGRVLVYSAALADADLNTVFSGLGTLWGISVTAVS